MCRTISLAILPNNGRSRIWVKVPEIPRTLSPPLPYFYMYAGNENALPGSNGADVFIYFDDFEDQTIGTQPDN